MRRVGKTDSTAEKIRPMQYRNTSFLCTVSFTAELDVSDGHFDTNDFGWHWLMPCENISEWFEKMGNDVIDG